MAAKKTQRPSGKKPTRGEPPRRGADGNDPGEQGKKLPGSGRKGGK